MMALLEERLACRRQEGSLRKLENSALEVDFASNDTLGLSKRLGAFPEAARWGSTGSRLLTGNSLMAEALEDRIASFHKADAGLLFNSGYLANMGLLSTVAGKNDVVLYDADIHASTRDGILLSRAKAYHFRHNDAEHLSAMLDRHKGRAGNLYVCIESVYSCDGACAPLQEIAAACKPYGARLIVDEAHATGAIGTQGRGLACRFHLESALFARVHTFGKALGAFGAIVLGSPLLKHLLVNFCRPFIYTTALPDPVLRAIEQAYAWMEQADEERLRLADLIVYFAFKARISRRKFAPSQTHIQALYVNGNQEALQLADQLKRRGILAKPLLHPTVPKGGERLRFCLHAYNSKEEIDRLFECLHDEPQ
jgi:8-amino-7-oxononanoate synthase